MDKLHAMQVFIRVVDSNSFSGAADALDITRSRVTTVIQQLEALLKVRLLNRTTRRISLTDDGAAYYDRCARIIADIEETETSFLTTDNKPKGKLKVDIPGSLGRLIIVPALSDFHARYPDIELMLGIGDKQVDLIAESVDCAIRIGPLQDSSLIGRRLGMSEFVTVASPEYLVHNGTPMTLDELNQHVAVNYFSSRSGRIINMDFAVDGRPTEVTMQSNLAANDGDAYLQCGVQGLGIIQVPRFMAASHIGAGKLVEILETFNRAPFPVSAVYPHNRHLSLRVRVFVDWAAELFQRCPLLRAADAGLKLRAAPSSSDQATVKNKQLISRPGKIQFA